MKLIIILKLYVYIYYIFLFIIFLNKLNQNEDVRLGPFLIFMYIYKNCNLSLNIQKIKKKNNMKKKSPIREHKTHISNIISNKT